MPLSIACCFSAAFISREEAQISVVPLMRAAMPVPDPPPVTEILIPESIAIKRSAPLLTRCTMVSEPLIIRDVDSFPLFWPQPAASRRTSIQAIVILREAFKPYFLVNISFLPFQRKRPMLMVNC